MADQANRDTRPNRPRTPMHRRMRPSDGNGDVQIDRELLAELDREEPLSLAEERNRFGLSTERIPETRVPGKNPIRNPAIRD